LDWKAKSFEIFSLQLILQHLFDFLELTLQVSGPHLGCQVEEVEGLDLGIFDGADFDFGCLVINAWDACNAVIQDLPLLTSALSV